MTNSICLDTFIYQPTFENYINKVKGSTQGMDVADGARVEERIHFFEVDTEKNTATSTLIVLIYRCENIRIMQTQCTVEPHLTVTSLNQSPLHSGHPGSVPNDFPW